MTGYPEVVIVGISQLPVAEYWDLSLRELAGRALPVALPHPGTFPAHAGPKLLAAQLPPGEDMRDIGTATVIATNDLNPPGAEDDFAPSFGGGYAGGAGKNGAPDSGYREGSGGDTAGGRGKE